MLPLWDTLTGVSVTTSQRKLQHITLLPLFPSFGLQKDPLDIPNVWPLSDSPAKNVLWDPLPQKAEMSESPVGFGGVDQAPVLLYHMPAAFRAFTAHLRHRKCSWSHLSGSAATGMNTESAAAISGSSVKS